MTEEHPEQTEEDDGPATAGMGFGEWTGENRRRARMDPLMTSKEAALILRIHPKVLERMAKAGEVPALKVGKFWRYRTSDLAKWVGSQVRTICQPSHRKPAF